MGRHHVHLSPDREIATRVGARRGGGSDSNGSGRGNGATRRNLSAVDQWCLAG